MIPVRSGMYIATGNFVTVNYPELNPIDIIMVRQAVTPLSYYKYENVKISIP